MTIDHIAENYGSHAIRSSGIEPKKRDDEKKAVARPAAQVSDKIQISDEARALKEKAGLLATAQEELKKVADIEIPDAKVRQVFARIMSQYYDSRQVLGSIADSLLDNGIQLAKDSGSDVGISKLNEMASLESGQIDEIRQKIENGFYDQQDVFDVIVQELFS
ncbi:hypothetical protein KAR48_12080 [bacterium]|nr:hypothetical protein [bacterium]